MGKSISIEGIPKFRMTICTKLKVLDKGISEERQEKGWEGLGVVIK